MNVDYEKEYVCTLRKLIDYGEEFSKIPKRIWQLNTTTALLSEFIEYYEKPLLERWFTDNEDLCPSILNSITNYYSLIETKRGIGDELFNVLANTLLETDPVVVKNYTISNSRISFSRIKPFVKTNLDIDELFNSIKTQVNDAYYNNSSFRRNYTNQNKKWLPYTNNEKSLISIVGDRK